MSDGSAMARTDAALPAWRDPQAWARVADVTAVLIALSLPWSTSLVGIFAVVWVITVLPTIEPRAFLLSLKRPICFLPVALAYPIIHLLQEKRIVPALLLGAIALSFVVNMALVIVSRTALVTMPIMLAVFALLHLRWRAIVVITCAAVVLAGLAWVASPKLRGTVGTFERDFQLYEEQNIPTSAGLRIEFWKKSLRFFAEAPLFGHGTGSTRGLFELAATGSKTSASAEVIGNPHNQTLNVAIQWGTLGIVVLYAMWLCHLLLFRGEGLVAWLGLLVVVQNIFTSLFNSHLFDFHEGWMYVLGVGIAGGTLLRANSSETAPEQRNSVGS